MFWLVVCAAYAQTPPLANACHPHRFAGNCELTPRLNSHRHAQEVRGNRGEIPLPARVVAVEKTFQFLLQVISSAVLFRSLEGIHRRPVIVSEFVGRPLNGSAPFGYQWKDKKMVPHPDEKVVRKLIYELFDQHKRLKRVSKELNTRGLRTRKGVLWSDTSVRHLIEDPTAKGEHRALFTQKTSGNNYGIKPQDQWVMSPVEPIMRTALPFSSRIASPCVRAQRQLPSFVR